MGELAVGAELDRAISERVFGKPHRARLHFKEFTGGSRDPDQHMGNLTAYGAPAYSTDLAAAWTVVDHLVSQGVGYFGLERKLDGTWEVEWTSHGADPSLHSGQAPPPRGIIHGGATPAEAIVRAAIELAGQAVASEVPQDARSADSDAVKGETV